MYELVIVIQKTRIGSSQWYAVGVALRRIGTIAVVVPAVSALTCAMQHHNEWITLGIDVIVSLRNQQSVVHPELGPLFQVSL